MLLSVGLCSETVKAWRLIGLLVMILKIIVPLIIIITAVVPIFNAIIKGNADEIINMGKTILRKIAAGIIVFLIPGVIGASIKLLVGTDYKTSDVSFCNDCFENPNGSECKKHIDAYDAVEEEEIKKNREESRKGEDLPNGGEFNTDDLEESSESND